MSNQAKLYSFGMKPHFKQQMGGDIPGLQRGEVYTSWEPIPGEVRYARTVGKPQELPFTNVNGGGGGPFLEVSFTHRFGITPLDEIRNGKLTPT